MSQWIKRDGSATWWLNVIRGLSPGLVALLATIFVGLGWIVAYIVVGWSGIIVIVAGMLATEYLAYRRDRRKDVKRT